MTTTVNTNLLPVIAPPDLPEVARDAVDLVLGEARQLGTDPAAHARALASDMIESGRWRLDPTNDGDLSAAEWAMRLLAQAQAEIDELTQARARFVHQIEDWFADATQRARTTVAFFEPHLSHYQRQRRLTDEAKRSLKLPSGVVKSTRYQPAIEVDDATAVIEWAKAHGLGDDLVETTESLRKAALNRIARPVVVTEDGTPDGPIVESYVEVPSIDDEPEVRRVPGVHVKAGHVDVKVVPQ